MISTSTVMISVLHDWQDLTGAFIGAIGAFLVWFVANWWEQKRLYKRNIYSLDRMIVDQINMVCDIRNTIAKFLDEKIPEAIKRIEGEAPDAYHIGSVFIPLFSVRPLNDELHGVTTRSGYIDNKLNHCYKYSKDIPYMIEDVRRQLDRALELNEKLSLSRSNSAAQQKKAYVGELKEFSRVMKDEILGINIPVYLWLLAKTNVALTQLCKIGWLKWRFEHRRHNFDQMEEYFEKDTQTHVKEIEKIFGFPIPLLPSQKISEPSPKAKTPSLDRYSDIISFSLLSIGSILIAVSIGTLPRGGTTNGYDFVYLKYPAMLWEGLFSTLIGFANQLLDKLNEINLVKPRIASVAVLIIFIVFSIIIIAA